MAGAPNDSYKNNTHVSGIFKHHIPNDVAIWPKWTCLDRRNRGDFTFQFRWPYAPYRLRRRLLRTNITTELNQGKITKEFS